MIRLAVLLTAAAALSACGGGENSPEPACKAPSGSAVPCKAVQVVKFGDSITHDEGRLMLDHLPVGSSFDNRGVYGATALHMILNDMPAWQIGTRYVISYGANECLHRFETAKYIADMRTIINSAKSAGVSPIIEAPWRMTSCLERIDGYRAALKPLAAELKVRLIDGDLRQDHAGDGIHLNPEHTTARVILVAAAINQP
jgi:hypothetical protein